MKASTFFVALALGASAAPASAEQLYSRESWANMASDNKAQMIGDIVTVLIFESASTTNQVETRTGKNTSLDGGFSAGGVNESLSFGLGGNYRGGGETERSDRFVASMTSPETIKQLLALQALREQRKRQQSAKAAEALKDAKRDRKRAFAALERADRELTRLSRGETIALHQLSLLGARINQLDQELERKLDQLGEAEAAQEHAQAELQRAELQSDALRDLEKQGRRQSERRSETKQQYEHMARRAVASRRPFP